MVSYDILITALFINLCVNSSHVIKAELVTIVIVHMVHNNSLRVSRFRMTNAEKSELNNKPTRAMSDDGRIRDDFGTITAWKRSRKQKSVCEKSEVEDAKMFEAIAHLPKDCCTCSIFQHIRLTFSGIYPIVR